MGWALQLPTGEKRVLTDGQYVLGRDPGCSIVVADNMVSRHHAVVTVRGSSAMVRDLGSTNGTFLAGRRLTSHVDVLVPADVLLQVGRAVCRLWLDVPQGAEAARDTKPPLRAFPAHERGEKPRQEWVLSSRAAEPSAQPQSGAKQETSAPGLWDSLVRRLRSLEWWFEGKQEAAVPNTRDALTQNLVFAGYAAAGVMIFSLLMAWLRAGGVFGASYLKIVSEAMRFVGREPRLLLLLLPAITAGANLLSASRPKQMRETGVACLLVAGFIYFYLQNLVQVFGISLDLTGVLSIGYYLYVLSAGASLGIGIYARRRT